MLSYLLAAWLNVTFDHQPFYDVPDIGLNLAVVHNFLGNPDLLFILLVRIGVVGVNNDGRVF